MLWQAAIFAVVLFSVVTLWAWNQTRLEERRGAAAEAANTAHQDENWNRRHHVDGFSPTVASPPSVMPTQRRAKRPHLTRWFAALMFGLVYVGGVVGSFEFFTKRFACTAFPSTANRWCGPEVVLNAMLWPFDFGREAARWAFKEEGRSSF
jgi:hypothetical protein